MEGGMKTQETQSRRSTHYRLLWPLARESGRREQTISSEKAVFDEVVQIHQRGSGAGWSGPLNRCSRGESPAW